MISRFGREAELLGYRRVIVNISGCQLYYRSEADQLTALVFFECPRGREFTGAQIDAILGQIDERFSVTPGQRRVVQGAVATEDAYAAGSLLYGVSYPVWILDEVQGRVSGRDADATVAPLRQKLEACLAGQYQAREARTDTGNGSYEEWFGDRGQTKGPRPGVFALTPVNTVLVLLNILAYLWVSLHGSTESAVNLMHFGALYYPAVFGGGEYYRLVTYMFLHAGFSHLFNNMLVLAFLGDNLERRLGPVKYLIFYLVSGVGAGLISVWWDFRQASAVVGVGASGAIFAVVGAMIYVLLRHKGRLEDLSLTRMILFVLLSLYNGFNSTGVDNVAHVGGFLLGFLLGMLFYRKKK